MGQNSLSLCERFEKFWGCTIATERVGTLDRGTGLDDLTFKSTVAASETVCQFLTLTTEPSYSLKLIYL